MSAPAFTFGQRVHAKLMDPFVGFIGRRIHEDAVDPRENVWIVTAPCDWVARNKESDTQRIKERDLEAVVEAAV